MLKNAETISGPPFFSEVEPRATTKLSGTDLSDRDMLRLLVSHGCDDLTPQIDPEGYATYPISGGGYGDVWKGRMRDGRDVAVKVWRRFLDKDPSISMKRAMREVYYWSKIKHDNIHELLGVTERLGQLGMVSLWMENGDLSDYIIRNPTVDCYPWCVQVAAGVSYLHVNEVIHGDIKAMNILVSRDLTIKISDFDCSTMCDCSLSFSKTGQIRMSTRWAAPELMGCSEEEEDIVEKTKQSDVYALAMTLLEILTGQLPYAEYKRDVAVLKAVAQNKMPKRPEALNESGGTHDILWDLLVKCWNHDYMARPDAARVLTSLRAEIGPHGIRNAGQLTQMSIEDMFRKVVARGCVDLSSQIDPDVYSFRPTHEGSAGDIYKGRICDGRNVAIKMWRLPIMEETPKNTERAMLEIDRWSKVKHENIQQLMGVVFHDGRLGMVSLWMEKGNLRDYVRINPRVDRYNLCHQVASGVAHLHMVGMIHGYLKAANVLISNDGTAKLSDFDNSILSGCALLFSETTNFGGGILRWMAPELVSSTEEGGIRRSVKSDVYALGMTILEIITGKPPYAEYKNDLGVLRAHFKNEPPIQPTELCGDIEPGITLWPLLLRCWNHDPSVRPSASQIQRSLQVAVKIH